MKTTEEKQRVLNLKPKKIGRANKQARAQTAFARLHYNLRMDYRNPTTNRTSRNSEKESQLVGHFFSKSDGTPSPEDPAIHFAKTDIMDNRENSVTGRDIVVVLPKELSDAQNLSLTGDLTHVVAKTINTSCLGAMHVLPYNTCLKNPLGAPKARNPHAHIMGSDRDDRSIKLRALGNPYTSGKILENLREEIAIVITRHLKKAGYSIRYVAPGEKTMVHPRLKRLYFIQKSWTQQVKDLSKMAANLAKALTPEPWLVFVHHQIKSGKKLLKKDHERLELAERAHRANRTKKNFETDLIRFLLKAQIALSRAQEKTLANIDKDKGGPIV